MFKVNIVPKNLMAEFIIHFIINNLMYLDKMFSYKSEQLIGYNNNLILVSFVFLTYSSLC